MHLIYQFTI